jgi:hypothetical protein
MEKDGRNPTRKRGRHLRVPVLPDEEAVIKRQAAAAGLSVAAYLRNVGMGYQIKGVLDHRRVDDLARINGDLGRLGGLLKLWLTNDKKLRQFGAAQMRQTITAVLNKISQNQDALRNIMRTVLRS